MPVHRHGMPSFLAHFGSWCSCTRLLAEGGAEDDGYSTSGRLLQQSQGACISRADLMAAASRQACTMKDTNHITSKEHCPSRCVKVISGVAISANSTSSCIEEDASVLVQLNITAEPVKSAPACQQKATTRSSSEADSLSATSNVPAGPATPSWGASRAVSRSDSNSTAGPETEAAAADSGPSSATAAVTVTAAVTAAVTTAAAVKAAAIVAAVMVIPGVIAASSAAAIVATNVVIAATVVRARLVAPSSSTSSVPSAAETQPLALANKLVANSCSEGVLTAAPLLATASAAAMDAQETSSYMPESSIQSGSNSDSGDVSSTAAAHGGLSFGIATEQSARQYQEDRAVGSILAGSRQLQGLSRMAFAAVFDGHGGSEAAEHLQQQAVPLLMSQLQRTAGQPEAAMQAIAELMEAQLLAADCTAGSTMTAVLVAGDQLVVTNIGDSRAVLCRAGQALQLTQDHKPSAEQEKARITTADPSADISSDGYCYDMGVSRGLGSCQIKADPSKKAFIAAADVVMQQLQHTDDFVVLGSDGLFDRLRNAEVMVTARRALAAAPGDCKTAAEALVKRALQAGSSDNTTAVVLLLHDRVIEMPKSNSRLFKSRAAPCSSASSGTEQ